jgi:EAL domain-containing protein (putative c-di-GMP-specific phosphodiesterase class I)/GGDEF domain-containing protein
MSGADAGIAWMTGQASARAELVDSLEDPAWLVDAGDTSVLHANAAAAAWFGATCESLLGRPAANLLPTLEDAAFWADVRSGAPGALDSDTELARGDGGVARVHRRVVPIGNLGAGRHGVACYLVLLRDRSGEHRAEQERDGLLAELRATLEATADGILVTDLKGRIQAFNRRFAAMWALPESALAERDDAAVYRWMSRQTLAPVSYQARLDDIAAHALLSSVDTVHLLDGAQLERHIQPQWSQGRPIGRVYSYRETNPRRPGAPRGDRGQFDEVSGWPDRVGLVHALDDAVGTARRDGTPLALLCIEFDRQQLFALDGQSQVRSLGELVEGLRSCIPAQHLLARLGGARFAVLVRHGSEAAAEGLARRVVDLAQRATGGPLANAGLPAAIGIAAYPQAGLCADDLLAHAEGALEQARHAGGSAWRVHAFGSLDDGPRLARLQRSLREGAAADALRLRYLPRVDMASGQVQSVEALLRWHDGEHGLLPPSQFLPLAERTGLSAALDDWALEQALRQGLRWRAAGFAWRLNLNVSVASCQQPGYARRVAAALDAAGWPAADLELDFTEPALKADPDAAQAQLQALHQLGVRILLDDCGRGDASLNLLRRFPFAAVKLDRELVVALGRAAGPEAGLAAALAAAARSLGLAVYAEGVEAEHQRLALGALGCVAWQGFLHSRPLDAASLLIQAQRQVGTSTRPGQADSGDRAMISRR